MKAPPPINPHDWRRFELAQRNFMRLYPRRLFSRRSKYWAGQFHKTLKKALRWKRQCREAEVRHGEV